MRLFLSLFIMLSVETSFAEIKSVTFAAQVKSFDEKNVTCSQNGFVITVPRKTVVKKLIHAGDVVLVRLDETETKNLITR